MKCMCGGAVGGRDPIVYESTCLNFKAAPMAKKNKTKN